MGRNSSSFHVFSSILCLLLAEAFVSCRVFLDSSSLGAPLHGPLAARGPPIGRFAVFAGSSPTSGPRSPPFAKIGSRGKLCCMDAATGVSGRREAASCQTRLQLPSFRGARGPPRKRLLSFSFLSVPRRPVMKQDTVQPLNSLNSLKRPYYVLGEDGNFKLESRDPPASEIYEGWADLIAEEERLWGGASGAPGAPAAVAKGALPLDLKEKINERLLKGRKAAISDYAYIQPLSRTQLFVVRPKQGPSCELMKKDEPRLDSLVKKLRWKYDSSLLPVADVRMQADVPLCEVFLAGPFPGTCRIFYARGATLQYRVRPRFRTVCPLLEKDERLKQKYGGDGCPGLFPTWDEEGILEEIDECMNLPPTDMQLNQETVCALLQSFPVNLEWDNLAALSPENEEERPYWYSKVHYPTRQAVQRAFMEGVEDFRSVIETEYKMLKEHDRKEGERLAHLKMKREREKKGF
ncbi:hypothetical protein Efla_001005 [Eimeria flavescens]